MKKKIWVKITWGTKKPLQMAGIARGTVTAMTGNAKFATPKVALPAMTTAATRVETAWANRKNGATGKDELTNSSNDLDVLLHLQGDYVSGIANSDETIIHSAGFEATYSGSNLARTAKPDVAVAPVLKSVNGGVVKARVTPVLGAKNYCYLLSVDASINADVVNGQINIAAGGSLFIINSTKSNVAFVGLPVLKNVNVAVIVSNANGDNGFSPVATVITIP